jgi:hypothetical protein
MDLYKIITRQGKKHFYESKTAYEKGLRYHIKYLSSGKYVMDYLTIECYRIGVDVDICWEQIDRYEISNDGEVISCYRKKLP